LTDFAVIRDDLGLKDTPHYSTLCYVAQRIFTKGEFVVVLVAATTSATARSPIGDKPTVAIDGTGLESRRTSQYFVNRSSQRGTSRIWTNAPSRVIPTATSWPGRP